MTSKAGAEAEVDVLEVGEELLGEQSDVGEQCGAVETRSPAGGEHLTGRANGLGRLTSVTGEGEAPLGVEVAGAVDRQPVAHQQPPGCDCDVGVRIELSGERRQPSGVGNGVVVEQGDGHGAGVDGVADSLVDAACESAVDGIAQHGQRHGGDLCGQRVEYGHRVVGRAVVDDHDGEVVMVLGGERADARTEVGSAVPVRDDDANPGHRPDPGDQRDHPARQPRHAPRHSAGRRWRTADAA